MKILIQRGSKLIQRENSVLKIRQHINLKWITNQDPLQGTGKSAQGYEAAWMGGEFGGGRIHVCVAEALHVRQALSHIASRPHPSTKQALLKR